MRQCKWWICPNQTQDEFCSRGCRGNYLVDRRRRVVKLALVLAAGGACVDCGYSRCIQALEFHHREPSAKVFAISGNIHRSFAETEREAAKCDLLCANCHRERSFYGVAERWQAAREYLKTTGELPRRYK